MTWIIGIGLTLLLLSWGSILWVYRQSIVRLWREPVLRYPVLIIESDDWGSGPDFHADRLKRLKDMLVSHRDSRSRHPVMTLGMVLAGPNALAMREADTQRYIRERLDAERFRPILEAIGQGQKAGVFSLQLHGMEHFWPPALLAAAANDPAIKDWFTAEESPNTEVLPSHLQSRWVDSRMLPSVDLSEAEIRSAVVEEVSAFKDIFGQSPRVAVPPTFVWTEDVEQAWAQAGIQVIVTPGRRYTRRDGEGRPAGDGETLYNGQHFAQEAIYLVRDIYFEPLLEHRWERAMTAIRKKYRQGRPALLETHRFNFLADEDGFRYALNEIDELLRQALRTWPALRFLTTEELGNAYRMFDTELFETRLTPRIHIELQRLGQITRLRKLAWITGLVLPAALLAFIARRWSRPRNRDSAFFHARSSR